MFLSRPNDGHDNRIGFRTKFFGRNDVVHGASVCVEYTYRTRSGGPFDSFRRCGRLSDNNEASLLPVPPWVCVCVWVSRLNCFTRIDFVFGKRINIIFWGELWLCAWTPCDKIVTRLQKKKKKIVVFVHAVSYKHGIPTRIKNIITLFQNQVEKYL